MYTKLLALYVLLCTGCRPNEAAYIVFNKSIFRNDYFLKTIKVEFKATMPSDFTKTKIDYFWLLPNEMKDVITLIQENNKMGFDNAC